MAQRLDVVDRGHDPLGVEESEDQVLVLAGGSHHHRQRRRADLDLEGFLAGYPVVVGSQDAGSIAGGEGGRAGAHGARMAQRQRAYNAVHLEVFGGLVILRRVEATSHS
jgi:hypothetical protein